MKYIFPFAIVLFSAFNAHPIHMAVTEVTYKNKSLQIIHKIFIDDLEKQIESNQKKKGKAVKLNLNTNKENPSSGVFINDYIQENFILKINGKETKAKFLGNEYETDAIWIYAEIEKSETPVKIEISDKILMDMYDDQTDFVHIRINDKKQSGRFEKDNLKQVFNF